MTSVRDAARVHVAKPVRNADRTKRQNRRGRVRHPVISLQVDPQVMAVARQAVRPGEKFVPVDETTVKSVYLK